jgi:hypothetical protein
MDPGADMLRSIRSGDINASEQTIMAFKQYIKRNLVDLNQVSQYSHSLISVFHVHALSILSFGTLCHLIKRVSIQDPFTLRNIYDPIIPFLLERLSDDKESIRLTSMKSIKTCIESSPNGEIDPIIHYLICDGLKGENILQLRLSILDLLYQIIESSANFSFSFKFILDNIVQLLNTSNQLIVEKVSQILILYFRRINPTNNLAKSDLLNSLILNDIHSNVVYPLLNSIDKNLLEKYQSNFSLVSMNDTKNEPISIQKSQKQLEDLLDKIPNWNIDDSSIKPININQNGFFHESLLNDFLLHFDGKETEKNWKYRQTLIIKIRQILRGDFLSNLSSFAEFIRAIKEPLCKGMLSLRTTLSNHSCQLCKELAIFAGSDLDFTFFEFLLSSLLKLTSARKIIQHQNSNVAIIAILLNTNVNTRIFNLLLTTIQDKNIQPRVYSGNWIQLLLLKHFTSDTEHFYYLVESIEPIIIKGLTDPIPLVKDAMRNAFWTLCELDPSYESKIMKQLDVSTVKALERSKKSISLLPIKRAPINGLIKEKGNLMEVQDEAEILKLRYEPIRKTQRSESVEVKSLTTEKKKMATRYHTISTPDEILSISPAITSTIINNKPVVADEFDDFTGRLKRENIIYDEITSASKQLQQDGFNKLLKENDSSLTIKFHNALNTLTILNPLLFYILFQEGNELFFKKISNYISTENTVRLFCLYLIESKNYQRIEFIINELSLEDLCLSIINILNFAIDTSKIDNINLSIQFIKNRFNLIDSVLKIFYKLIEIKKNIIKSYLLSSIFECLNLSFSIVGEDESTKNEYLKIFKLCLNKYNDLFLRSIDDINDSTIKKRLYTVLNIQQNLDNDINDNNDNDNDNDMSISNDLEFGKLLSPIKVQNEEIDENVDQMTRIIPKIKNNENINNILNNGELFKQHEFVSDMTMIIPKSKGNGLFDFDNIELRYDGSDSEMSIKGLEEQGCDDENDDSNENDIIPRDEFIEEGTDVSMIDKKNELEIPMLKEESFGKDEEIEHEVENILHSDSTPDINLLKIEEKGESMGSIESELSKEINGYLGLVLNEFPEECEINDVFQIQNVNELSYIFNHSEEFNDETIYESMKNLLQNNKLCVESIAILKYFAIFKIEVVDFINEYLIEVNELFFGFREYMNSFIMKDLLTIKLEKYNTRIQEILLGSIRNKLQERDFDGEDIFIIEIIIKLNINNDEESYLRMLSFQICKELFEIHKNGYIDKNGIELVDQIIIDNFNEKVLNYCKQ